jgi:hypothetical protein
MKGKKATEIVWIGNEYAFENFFNKIKTDFDITARLKHLAVILFLT